MSLTVKQEKYRRIAELKQSIPIEALCHSLPPEFAVFLNYARQLKFEQKPDYDYLRDLFRGLAVRAGCRFDNHFDWVTLVRHCFGES